jgi:hypothetical protein
MSGGDNGEPFAQPCPWRLLVKSLKPIIGPSESSLGRPLAGSPHTYPHAGSERDARTGARSRHTSSSAFPVLPRSNSVSTTNSVKRFFSSVISFTINVFRLSASSLQCSH